MSGFFYSLRYYRVIAAIVLSLACSLILCWPILSQPGWYAASEAYRYPYLLLEFREQFLAGHYYPRWLPALMGKYGFPAFVYFPPGFWVASLPFSLFIANPIPVVKVTLVVILTLGGIGVSQLASRFCKGGSTLFVTLLFYFCPVLSGLLYDSGDFSELMALCLCPWALFYMVSLLDPHACGGSCFASAVWLAVVLAANIYSCPAVACWLVIVLIACSAGVVLGSNAPRRLLSIIFISAILAAALSSPYWYPALALRYAISFDPSPGLPLSVFRLFGPHSYKLGLILPLLALAGFYYGRSSRLINAATVCYLGFIPLLFFHSPSLLSVLTALEMIGVASFCQHIEIHWNRDARWGGGIAILALLIIAWQGGDKLRGVFDLVDFVNTRPQVFDAVRPAEGFKVNTMDTANLSPRNSGKEEAAIAYNPEGIPVIGITNRTDSDFTVWAASEGVMQIIVNQFYFPGWKISINGIAAAECPATPIEGNSFCAGPNGRILIHITAGGHHRIHAWYDGVPHAMLRNSIAWLAGLASLVMLWRLRRIRPVSYSPVRSENP